MIITKKRIRNIDSYLSNFQEGESARIILRDIERFQDRLVSLGFNLELTVGSTVLPTIVGPVTDYNANGREEKLVNEPKETFYVAQLRTFKDWHRNEHTRLIDMPYERYRKRFHDAPSQELTILETSHGHKALSSEAIEINDENKSLILHTVNMFLEISSECEIVGEDFLSRQQTPITRLNWHILPQGQMPWQSMREPLTELLTKTNVENKEDALNRFEFMNNFSPDFVAIGNGAFNEYVIFGFRDRDLYVLENSKPGNATYIFSNDWQTLSQLTKAEILAEQLQEDRIIHTRRWKQIMRDKLLLEEN